MKLACPVSSDQRAIDLVTRLPRHIRIALELRPPSVAIRIDFRSQAANPICSNESTFIPSSSIMELSDLGSKWTR